MNSTFPSLRLASMLAVCVLTTSALADDGESLFESRIRPLLVAHCYECHSDQNREGGLRLDSRPAWQAGGEHGPVIAPGMVDSSSLIRAVRYTDSELQMPPAKKLSAQEVADLETWVSLGAPDPRDSAEPTTTSKHELPWSLQPLLQPTPPAPDVNDWSQLPLDRFVLATLQSAGLQPSPLAEPRTLIRRVAFALTGMPPAPAEVDTFIHDYQQNADVAYARLIDHLLSSPHYGEQWARHWLDVARYSDTKGYVYAREEKRWIHAAGYRDWVVRAFNEDLRYDRFVQLQIAADQLVPPGSPDLAAMGYLTLGRRFLGVTHDIIDDRIDVVTRGILGLTVACARCHDHKYDPIPTRDYYALYGVFQSCAEQVVQCGATSDVAFSEELEKRQSALRTAMDTRREEQSARVRARVADYLMAQLELEKYPEEVFNQIIEPGDINPYVVRKWQAFLAKDELSAEPMFAEWHQLRNEPGTSAPSVDSGKGAKDAVFAEQQVSRMRPAAARYAASLAEVEKHWRELLAKNPTATELVEPKEEAWRQVLYGIHSPCHVPDEHIANIEMYFPTGIITELWKFQGEVDRWVLDNANSPVHATILVDRPLPITPRVFARGNPLNKGAEVPRRFLELLGGKDAQPFTQGSGRLELALALTDPSNPLTPRVIVNRVWMHLFGRGLVSSASDFGNRSETPSHPELLDWLTQQFINSGWSIKELQRTIMLSHTYRQSSAGPTDLAAYVKADKLDPENRWLWRMSAHRLSFEETRDAWLAATGELNLQLSGRPETLFSADSTRRSLYTFIDRENVQPVLRMFDFANPDLSIPQRSETTVPQQALFAMNHAFIADRARKLTELDARLASADRVRQLYARLFQREPDDVELSQSLAFVQAEAVPPPSATQPSSWNYGYGEFDSQSGRLKSFTPLPRFVGSAWQGGNNYPDSQLGWLQLTAVGGHPGNDLKHAVVRRWTAPQDGNYALNSVLVHEPEVGDGVRAFVSHNRLGLLRSATVHHSTEQINLESVAMAQGDSIDFVVDIRDSLNSDQFLWAPKLSLIATAGAGLPAANQQWAAESDFAGQTTTRLDRWQQLAQVLMLTNEFMFID